MPARQSDDDQHHERHDVRVLIARNGRFLLVRYPSVVAARRLAWTLPGTLAIGPIGNTDTVLRVLLWRDLGLSMRTSRGRIGSFINTDGRRVRACSCPAEPRRDVGPSSWAVARAHPRRCAAARDLLDRPGDSSAPAGARGGFIEVPGMLPAQLSLRPRHGQARQAPVRTVLGDLAAPYAPYRAVDPDTLTDVPGLAPLTLPSCPVAKSPPNPDGRVVSFIAQSVATPPATDQDCQAAPSLLIRQFDLQAWSWTSEAQLTDRTAPT